MDLLCDRTFPRNLKRLLEGPLSEFEEFLSSLELDKIPYPQGLSRYKEKFQSLFRVLCDSGEKLQHHVSVLLNSHDGMLRMVMNQKDIVQERFIRTNREDLFRHLFRLDNWKDYITRSTESEFGRFCNAYLVDQFLERGYEFTWHGLAGAAVGKNVYAVRRFLESGALHRSYKDHALRVSPVHYAFYSGNEEIMNLFTMHGANLNHGDYFGDTPLYNILRYHSNPVAAEYLLSHGADPNIVPPGKNPWVEYERVDKNYPPEIVQLLHSKLLPREL